MSETRKTPEEAARDCTDFVLDMFGHSNEVDADKWHRAVDGLTLAIRADRSSYERELETARASLSEARAEVERLVDTMRRSVGRMPGDRAFRTGAEQIIADAFARRALTPPKTEEP